MKPAVLKKVQCSVSKTNAHGDVLKCQTLTLVNSYIGFISIEIYQCEALSKCHTE